MQPINLAEFTAGAIWWRTKTTWPDDFHNSDYPVLAAQNPDGRFDAAWWARVQPRLAAWKAFRPVPRAVVAANVVANAADLTQAWKTSCAPYLHADIADPEVTWEAIRAFPEVVFRLKPTRSPVFASKLCHFLLPKVFPVVDGLALGGHSMTYEAYFRLVKDTWVVTPEEIRSSLIAEITNLVELTYGKPLAPEFPAVTKIVELALIGRKHPQP
ncbi:hypothetical protein [Winogradskya humida]|nr:hypothetical protein [Actinoplanes humidus]